MSENFRGVTFAEQGVTPADDAIVRRAILPDGILTGCEISYSGSTLTMAAGYIIACGRTFQHIAAQNWAVVDATSGFARLVLTIDLTKTATEATFNQIESSIEYAAAEDGFVQLEQSDINLSGTRYQIAAAVVSLGTGGITGIVSQLALSRVEGGGGLNFSVVDGLTQPGDPKENMIWVYTEGMTGWYMQPTQPENMQPGEVWIRAGTASQIAFNALRKHTLMVYPLSAKQMGTDGKLVDVSAKSWQNGAWVEWITYLLDGSNQFEEITGGWIQDKNLNISGYQNTGTVTFDDDGITLSNAPGATSAIVRTKNKIKLSDYSTLTVNAKSIAASNSISIRVFIITGTSGDVDTMSAAILEKITSTAFTDYPLTLNLDGEYYVALVISAGRSGTVKKMLLS